VLHVAYVLDLSGVRVVRLPLEAFHLFPEIGAISSLLQRAVRVVKLLLEVFHLLAVTGASVSFVQHFWHVSVTIDFDIH
jgi:hypothetical protein